MTTSSTGRTSASRYVAVELSRNHPAVLSWARERGCSPAKRWALYVTSDDGGLGFPAGWEGATFTSYSEAKAAILWLEKFNGSYQEYRLTDY